MRTLLVDDHDSFTYNLFDCPAQVSGGQPEVVRTDDPRWRSGCVSDIKGSPFPTAAVPPGHRSRQREAPAATALRGGHAGEKRDEIYRIGQGQR